jgi:hypothetical protein
MAVLRVTAGAILLLLAVALQSAMGQSKYIGDAAGRLITGLSHAMSCSGIGPYRYIQVTQAVFTLSSKLNYLMQRWQCLEQWTLMITTAGLAFDSEKGLSRCAAKLFMMLSC